jgi:cell division protein FtsL
MVEAVKGKVGRSNVVKLSRFSVPKNWLVMIASVALSVIFLMVINGSGAVM